MDSSKHSLAFIDADPYKRIGALKKLSDELLLRVLDCLSASCLGSLAATCKALYCFASHEEVWRKLLLEEFGGAFSYKGTWKATYLQASKRRSALKQQGSLRVNNFYSDLLYQPFLCATTPFLPEWLEKSNVDTRAGLTTHEFRRQYEIPNKPVIVTDIASQWEATRTWDKHFLRNAFAEQQVTVGNYDMAFDDFLDYATQSCDDMPLYLFDKDFAKKAPHLANDYKVPKYFQDDLFSLLGEESRPDYRWLIMGPQRSGSSFHKDPNSTSAWNAVISGSKKWILYPPNTTPPGVMASQDEADVAAPVSLVEWFLNFYEQTQESNVKPRECIVRAGELLFVPRGWWHMAINLEESIAVTQNYVSTVNLPHVLKFLASQSDELISGCPAKDRKTLHSRFVAALEEHRPDVLRDAMNIKQKRKAGSLPSLFSEKPQGAKKQGFHFGFGC